MLVREIRRQHDLQMRYLEAIVDHQTLAPGGGDDDEVGDILDLTDPLATYKVCVCVSVCLCLCLSLCLC